MTAKTTTTCDQCDRDISKADLKSRHTICLHSELRDFGESDYRADPLPGWLHFCDLQCAAEWIHQARKPLTLVK